MFLFDTDAKTEALLNCQIIILLIICFKTCVLKLGKGQLIENIAYVRNRARMSCEQKKIIVTRAIHIIFFQSVKYTDVTIIVILSYVY